MTLERTMLLLLLLLFPLIAFAAPDPCPPKQCGGNEYEVFFLKNPRCKSCLGSGEAPSPVLLQCFRQGSVYNCEVWPQGPGLTYHWTSTGQISLFPEGSTAWPYQSISCLTSSGGHVQVEVESPFGLRATQQMQVNCGPPTIEY